MRQIRQGLKQAFLFLPLLFCGHAGAAQNRISLNGQWHFALAKTEKQEKKLEHFGKEADKVKLPATIVVPSNWAMQGFEEPVYRRFKDNHGSVGFYRKTFEIPREWMDKRVLLHFGGVWQSCDIWLNGQFVGDHHNGFTSFSVDVTGLLKERNVLAVKVQQTGFGFQLDVFDDWSLGGIYRDVSLEAMPRDRWIESVVAQTDFDSAYRDAILKLRVMVGDKHNLPGPGNYPKECDPYALRVQLKTLDGRLVGSRQVDVPAHVLTSRESHIQMLVAQPKHWTAETPNLYQLEVDLLEDGQPSHSYRERIGFRKVSAQNGQLTVNGQTVKLRGVNRHDEHPDVGRATRREHWLQDLMLMKEANINYVRCSHYTPARGFIELCDSLGFYVGNEIAFGGGAVMDYNPAFLGYGLQRSYETVMRDINSPSIIYWSVSNESPLSESQLAIIKNTKAIDPSRPVLMPWRYEDWMPDDTELLSIHYWHPREYDSIAGNSRRPIITTEYTHAYGETGMGGLEERWRMLTRHPAGAGGAVWMWADQGLRLKTPVPQFKANGMNKGDRYLRIQGEGWDGITDSYRNPTGDFRELKAVYAQAYPAVRSVTYTPGQQTVDIPIQNDFDFTNLREVQLRWRLFVDSLQCAEGTATVPCAPHAQALFRQPLNNLDGVAAGQTCYVQYDFIGKDGHLISQRAVELVSREQKTQGVSPLVADVHMTENGQGVTLSVGPVQYAISKATGEICTVSKDGRCLVKAVRPDIWRSWDDCEVTVSAVRKGSRLGIDYDRYTPVVEAWTCEEEAGLPSVKARVKYVVDTLNAFTVDYHYQVNRQGQLTIHYSMLPQVQVKRLPWVGMRLESEPGRFNRLHWLGLGPWDAYPNRKSAPFFGYWGGAVEDAAVQGIKQIRRIAWEGQQDGISIQSDEAYMVCDGSDMGIYSAVYPRPEKGREADDWFPLLRTDTGVPFVGSFSLSVK